MSDDLRPLEIEDCLAREGWVRRLAHRLVDSSESPDDVVQDVWLAILQRRPEAVRRVSGWLKSTVRNVALMRAREMRARSRRERTAGVEERLPSTADLVERTMVQKTVVEAVLELSEPYRSVVLLRFYDDMMPVDIARLCRVPPSTIRVRLKRALEMLRERIGRDESSPGERELLLFLLPLLAPRTAPPSWVAHRLAAMGVVAAGVAIGVALVAGGHSGDPPGSLDETAAAAEATAPTVARRRAAPSPADGAPSEATAARAGAAISGRVRLTSPDGRPVGPLTLEATPLRLGPDSDRDAFRPEVLQPPEPLHPVARARVENGERFALAIPAAGRYWLSVAAVGVAGRGLLMLSSREELDEQLELLPSVDVRLAPGDRRHLEALVAPPATAAASLYPAGAGCWRLDGPVFPGLRLGWREVGRETIWWTSVSRPSFVVHPPRVAAHRAVRLHDPGGGPVADATLTLLHAGRDNVDWTARVRARGGAATVPIPEQLDDGLGALVVRSPGRPSLTIRAFTQTCAAPEGGAADEEPVRIVLAPRTRRAAIRLLAEGGEPIAAAAVVVVRGTTPVLRAVSNGSGIGALERLPVSVVARDPARLGLLRPLRGDDRLDAFVFGEGGSIHRVGDLELDDLLDDPPLAVTLTEHGRRSLRLLAGGDRRPVEGARVRVLPVNAGRAVWSLLPRRFRRSGPDGRIALPPLGPGEWLIVVDADGFEPHRRRIGDAPAEEVCLTLMRRPDEGRKGTLRLRFVDESGRPVVAAPLRLTEPARNLVRSLTTDEDGRVAVQVLANEGFYPFLLAAPGRAPSVRSPVETPLDGREHEIIVVPVDVVPCDVVDAGGCAVPFACVRTGPADGDPAGRRRTLVWRPGQPRLSLTRELQRMTVFAPGHRPASRDVLEAEVAAGARIVVPLAVGPRLRGRVEVEEGVGPLRLELVRAEPEEDSALAEAFRAHREEFAIEQEVSAGPFELPPVTPGRYDLVVAAGARELLRRPVELYEDLDIGALRPSSR